MRLRGNSHETQIPNKTQHFHVTTHRGRAASSTYNEDKEYVRPLETTIAEWVAPVDIYNFDYKIMPNMG